MHSAKWRLCRSSYEAVASGSNRTLHYFSYIYMYMDGEGTWNLFNGRFFYFRDNVKLTPLVFGPLAARSL
jgi:hypothetical protein